MRRIGGLVILPAQEYEARLAAMRDSYDKQIATLNQQLTNMSVRCQVEEELNANQARTIRTTHETYLAGYNEGKWHSAGGYGRALMIARTKQQRAQAWLERWRPIVAALETTPGQFTAKEQP